MGISNNSQEPAACVHTRPVPHLSLAAQRQDRCLSTTADPQWPAAQSMADIQPHASHAVKSPVVAYTVAWQQEWSQDRQPNMPAVAMSGELEHDRPTRCCSGIVR